MVSKESYFSPSYLFPRETVLLSPLMITIRFLNSTLIFLYLNSSVLDIGGKTLGKLLGKVFFFLFF